MLCADTRAFAAAAYLRCQFSDGCDRSAYFAACAPRVCAMARWSTEPMVAVMASHPAKLEHPIVAAVYDAYMWPQEWRATTEIIAVTLDGDSVLSRQLGRRSRAGEVGCASAARVVDCSLGPMPRRSSARRMRAESGRDGRACAQAHPDDHGRGFARGRRSGGVELSLPALTGVVACRGAPCLTPSRCAVCRACAGSSRGRASVVAGIRWARFEEGQKEKRVFVCRHPRSCPESQE